MHSYTAVKDLMFSPRTPHTLLPIKFLLPEYLVKPNRVAAQHYNQDWPRNTYRTFPSAPGPLLWPFHSLIPALPLPRTDHFSSCSDKVLGFPLAADSWALAFKFKQIFKNSQNGNQEGNVFQSTKPGFMCNFSWKLKSGVWCRQD